MHKCTIATVLPLEFLLYYDKKACQNHAQAALDTYDIAIDQSADLCLVSA